jgi:acetyltransferase-like isoleucine patch superfamily enzyme
VTRPENDNAESLLPHIHETAVVEPGVSLGSATRVWHHAHLREGATVGADCVLGKNVYVDAGVTIGSRVKLQNNVSVYSGVHLEDEVFVGPSAVFTNDLYPRATSPDWEVVATRVRKGASIGGNATIVCGVEIGEWATVGAGAVVTRSVSPHELVVGNPARRLGWVCECGRLLERTSGPPTTKSCSHCGRTQAWMEPSGTPGPAT